MRLPVKPIVALRRKSIRKMIGHEVESHTKAKPHAQIRASNRGKSIHLASRSCHHSKTTPPHRPKNGRFPHRNDWHVKTRFPVSWAAGRRRSCPRRAVEWPANVGRRRVAATPPPSRHAFLAPKPHIATTRNYTVKRPRHRYVELNTCFALDSCV